MTKYYVDPDMLLLVLTSNKDNDINVHLKEMNKENDDENVNEDDGKDYAGVNLPPLSPCTKQAPQ